MKQLMSSQSSIVKAKQNNEDEDEKPGKPPLSEKEGNVLPSKHKHLDVYLVV